MLPTPPHTPGTSAPSPAAAAAAATAAGVTALIPLRTGGKSRLQAELDHDGRAALVLAMLDDVLTALRTAGVTDVRVLCGDVGATAAAQARGLVAVPDPVSSDRPTDRATGDRATDPRADPGDTRLRLAVDAGLAAVGASRVRLVVAADLPLLTGEEVTTILASPADVTLSPTRGGGTALLRLASDAILPAQYGPGSARAHLDVARRLGLTVAEISLPGAGQDVDGAADLRALGAAGSRPVGTATASFLAGRCG